MNEHIKAKHKDIYFNPKPKDEQDKCEHEWWLNFIPFGCWLCSKCGARKEPTQEDMDNF